MPSTVLQNECLFQRLFHTKPDYNFIKIFAYLCFPYVGSKAMNKFQPETYPCVSIGYYSQHKAYRCLHLSTGSVYLSHYIVFNESCFPLNNINNVMSLEIKTDRLYL